MTEEQAKEAIQAISRALQALRLYPPQHPATQDQLQDCLTSFSGLFLAKDSFKMGILDHTLMVEEHLFAYPSPAEEEVSEILESHELEGFLFRQGLTEEELTAFLLLLKSDLKGDDFQQAMSQQNIGNIETIKFEFQDEEVLDKPRDVYNDALEVVEGIFDQVRMGQVPSSDEAIRVVKKMARLTFTDPHALLALSLIKDYDNYTFTHSVNVSVIAMTVGRACNVSEEELRILGLGGLLHDLGKLKVDVGIINKPGRLTDEEFAEIRNHPSTGAELAKQMENVGQEVIDIVHYHHLRHDRQGYPSDGQGRALSRLVDMATIADTYDAMTTLRAYQRPISPRVAVTKMKGLSGTALHPDFLTQFIDALGEYPVGTLVRLDDNEIGLVVEVDIDDPENMEIKILFDAGGARLTTPRSIALDPASIWRIVAEVDPFLKGIDVTAHFP